MTKKKDMEFLRGMYLDAEAELKNQRKVTDHWIKVANEHQARAAQLESRLACLRHLVEPLDA